MLDLYEFIIEEYRENLETYNKAKEVINSTLENIVDELGLKVNAINARVKTEDSLRKKLELKGSKYKTIKDLTDIVGVRVITFYQGEVDKIASKIITSFDIDWDNSIDKRKIHNIDQFGYMSLHYIVRIPKSLFYDEKYPLINELFFEIQIRTNLQHTWASIFHGTGYKSDVEVPKDILRRFSRLAGLLEMADEEFQNLHDYLAEYRRKVNSVVKSGKFDEVELTGDSYKAYVSAGGFDKLNNKIASINNMEIAPSPLDRFLKAFKLFEFNTLKDLDDLVKEYSDLAYQLELLQFTDTDIDIITSSTGPLALCVVYTVKMGYGAISIQNLLDSVFGQRNSHARLANKFYANCKTLGIIREEENNGK